MKSMRKNTWLPLIGLRTFLFVTTAFTIVSCSDDKGEDGYNPNLPVRISELSPQEGGYFDKVILQGENFGNNPKKVRVFFNKKEAIVVGASGDRVLVHVPKLPGDDCKIGMLLNGNTTDTIFAEKHFAYEKNYQLIYVAGQLNSNTETFIEGSLETTTFANSMQHLACDPSGVIYMNHKNTGQSGSLIYINEPENYSKFLDYGASTENGGSPSTPYYDDKTEKVYFCAHHAPFFWEVDPKDSWSFVKRKLIAPDASYQAKGYRPVPSGQKLEYMCSYARATDANGESFIYCRTWQGQFFRFKLEDRVYDYVTTFAKSDACLATDPDDPTKIYCALNEYNKITCIDLTKNPEDSGFETDVCGIQGPGAYQDGHVSVARLNNPQQILSMHDPETGEKVIYICDANNNCVRMYNMETKLMSTVAGIGGKSGYAAGNPTVSRMNRPYGICITPENDIYVADAGNKVIMKLAFM